MTPATDVYLIDAYFHRLRLLFLAFVDFYGFESHSVRLLKWHLYFLSVIFDRFLDDLSHLDETEPAHEAKRSSLEGDNRWYFSFELLGSIENSTVTSYCDDESYEIVMLARNKLQTSQFLMFRYNFFFSASIGEVVEGFRSLGDSLDGFLDELKDLLFFVDAADHQNG